MDDDKEIETIDSNFVKHYLSYLKYDLNDL